MAEEFLSQEEVNLLLQTLGKEEEKKQVVEEEKVKPLDLSLFEHILAGRVPGLELIFEKWVTGLKRGLASVVASIPTIFKEGVSLVRFSEFVEKLTVPCAIGLFSIYPLRGTCLISIDPKLIYIIVSSVFGGPAKVYKIEGKEFTRVEMRIIQRVLNVCYQELEAAWNTVMDVKINPIGVETNPALLTVARPQEKLIQLKLNIVIEGSEGQIQLVIPEDAIAPYKEMLKGITEAKTKDVEERLLRVLLEIPVMVDVILGRGEIDLGHLLELKKGDVIILDRQIREPLELRVQDTPKMLAFLGQVGNRKAIKIYKLLEDSHE